MNLRHYPPLCLDID